MRRRDIDDKDGKRLSPKQGEVLQLIAGGLTSEEIAKTLGIAHQTVIQHRFTMIKKLRAKNACQAVSLAFKTGLLKW